MFLEKEKGSHIAFHALIRSLGFNERAEEKTNRGRIDEIIEVNSNLIYVIELKLDADGEKALKQIKEKRYYEQYFSKAKVIHLLGINFSSKERNITDWKEEIVRIG